MEMYKKDKYSRIREGDIFRDIVYVEDTIFNDIGEIGVSYLTFPYIIVLSQDCDLESDYRAREKLANPDSSDSTDTVLESILICPAYDKDLFVTGKHLVEMELNSMASWSTGKEPWKILVKNCNPRYHYLKGSPELQTNDMVIDFKHFYTIPRTKLYQDYEKSFVGSISPIYRELLSQRFANYLSRIGLPDPEHKGE